MKNHPVNSIQTDQNTIKVSDFNSLISLTILDHNNDPIDLTENIEYFFLTKDDYKYYEVTDFEFRDEKLYFKMPHVRKGIYKIEIKDMQGSIYPSNEDVYIQLNQSFDGRKEVVYTTIKEDIINSVQPIIFEHIQNNREFYRGEKGQDGKDGKDGRNGLNGLDGEDGRDGKDGRDGIDGKDGINGVDGEKGEKGEKGDKGDKGDRGPEGPEGPMGPVGPEILAHEINKVYRSTEGTVGSEDSINTIIGYKDNDIVTGIRGAHVQQGSKFNENIVGGDASTIGKYEQNVVDPNITNAHYAVIGGYDNVNNALAGLIISMHSYIHEIATHGTIYGGSYHNILDGDYSTIVGGTMNTIDADNGGAYSAILGGNRGNIFGKFSNIISGFSNRIGNKTNQKEYSSVISSYNSTIDGNYASIISGNECKATKDYSMARGKGAVANNVGESVLSTGKFKTAGDSGQSTMHLMRKTDTGFETQLLLDDGTSSIITPVGVNTILSIKGTVTGIRDNNIDGGVFNFNGVLFRGVSGELEIKNIIVNTEWASNEFYNVKLKVNPANNAYQIIVQGVNEHTINWSCKLESVWSRNI